MWALPKGVGIRRGDVSPCPSKGSHNSLTLKLGG